MAMALLLIGSLLFVSFARLLRADLGYDPSHVLTFRVAHPSGRSSVDRARFADTLVQRLRLLPAVASAGAAGSLPLTLSEPPVALSDTPFASATGPAPPPPPPGIMPPAGMAIRNLVTRDFLDALGTRVLSGRGFDATDEAGAPQVMLVNEAVLRSGLIGDRPIGRRIYAVGPMPWTVVGVVKDVVRAPGVAPAPQVYFHLRQASGVPQYFAVRSAGDPVHVAPQVRALVTDLDSHSTAVGIISTERVVSNSLSRQRLLAALVGGFAALAVALAAIGIYSLVGFVVTQRTQEIGIRAALGAPRGRILWLVVGQTSVLTIVGIAIGTAGAVLLARQLGHQVYGLSALNPLTVGAVAVVFAAVTIGAALGPARRATAIDPVEVLRAQ
jgi:predicted permease